MSPTRPDPSPDHLELAKSRLLDILSQRVVATARILEHLISDAGDEGLEPYVVGMARKSLVRDDELASKTLRANGPLWFYLPNASPDDVDSHIAPLADLLRDMVRGPVTRRRGQCLELAIYRALCGHTGQYFGRFPDFEPTDPKRRHQLYRKQEPPSHIGNRATPGDRPLDFLYRHDEAGYAGVEAKNVREWLYPDHDDIKKLLGKCVALDCVPVLVARRFPRATVNVLGTCGVVLHQTRSQLYCVVDEGLAQRVRRQDAFGFDDIRVGDEPDAPLVEFIGTTLPEELPAARQQFDRFKDLLARYAGGEIQYREFVGRVRLRAADKDDADWDDDDQDDPDDTTTESSSLCREPEVSESRSACQMKAVSRSRFTRSPKQGP